MNLPKYLLACALLVALCPELRAQRNEPCMEIKVEMKVEKESPDLPERSKIVLKFESVDYRDFKLFLFSGRESDNRLDLTTSEIKDLRKGSYTLIVQGKDEKKFCSKQFTFKIN